MSWLQRWFPLVFAVVGTTACLPTGETLAGYNRKRNGTIVIEGRVVDGEGQPVTDVTAYIDRFIASGIEGKSVQSKEKVGGEFHFHFARNSNVEITFRRKGHHAADLFYSFTRPSEGVVVKGKTHTYRDVPVVLTKIKNLASLHRYSLLLKYPIQGEATVWDISGVGSRRVKTTRATVLVDGTHPPEKVVYAAMVPTEPPMPAFVPGGKVVCRPAGQVFRIGISDGGDGGFIMVPASAAERTRYPMRELMEAPETGYVPFVDLTDDQILDSRKSKNYRFYCKLNGLYGKGRIMSIFFLPERGLEIGMEFLLQPDGSRNLETTQ